MFWIVETEKLYCDNDGWFDANGEILRKFEIVTEAWTMPFSKEPIDEGFCGEFNGNAVRAHGKFETIDVAREAVLKIRIPELSQLSEWEDDWCDESVEARWDVMPRGYSSYDIASEFWSVNDVKEVLQKHGSDVAATVAEIRALASVDGVWLLDVEELVREAAEYAGC